MKKILLALIASSSIAIIDHNFGMHSSIGTEGPQLGVDYYYEQEHRFGSWGFKGGGTVNVGINVAGKNKGCGYVALGLRDVFLENHAVVIALKETTYVETPEVFKGIINEVLFSYQRKIRKSGNCWIEFSVAIPAYPQVVGRSYYLDKKEYPFLLNDDGLRWAYSYVQTDTNYSIGLKTFYYSYE